MWFNIYLIYKDWIGQQEKPVFVLPKLQGWRQGVWTRRQQEKQGVVVFILGKSQTGNHKSNFFTYTKWVVNIGYNGNWKCSQKWI